MTNVHLSGGLLNSSCHDSQGRRSFSRSGSLHPGEGGPVRGLFHIDGTPLIMGGRSSSKILVSVV